MTEAEKVHVYDQVENVPERSFSGGTVLRVAEAMKLIKQGKKVDFDKLYNLKNFRS